LESDLNQLLAGSAEQTLWPKLGVAGLAGVFLLLAAFVGAYMWKAGIDTMSSIDGVRPLLVAAAVVSTIGFGGALLLGALFSSDGSFDNRFRSAREVFLVFAGIFGTVVGFYFGAGDGGREGLQLDSSLSGQSLLIHVRGGSPPYRISAVGDAEIVPKKDQESENGFVQFEVTSTEETAITVVATDSKGVVASAIVQAKKSQTGSQSDGSGNASANGRSGAGSGANAVASPSEAGSTTVAPPRVPATPPAPVEPATEQTRAE